MSDTTPADRPRISILGVRGVPAAHGGFETFAARLAPYLAAHGWAVTVYCQEEDHQAEKGASIWESTWEGTRRVHITVGAETPFNSIRFDHRCISHVIEHRPEVVLILGYNTAVFSARLRIAGIPTVINMDGIEWSRSKWSLPARAWLYLNERAGSVFAHHLIADHPQIERHLRSRLTSKKISVIPYGADSLEASEDQTVLDRFGLISMGFATIIARPEPENSILEMVRAFSAEPRGLRLLVLGKYLPDKVDYHAQVLESASGEVSFVGAIYDRDVVQALRRHSSFYLHGHRVGGCNPSLLEAMGAGNSVIAHDNRFNRWVVRQGAGYFSDEESCRRALKEVFCEPDTSRERGLANRLRAQAVFNWPDILRSYSELLTDVVSEVAATEGALGWGRRPHWQLDADTS